ncbi:MAG: hypothetical protein RR279_05180 [Alistipes sp.]
MKLHLFALTFVGLFAATAASSQELIAGADFSTYFDNREYTGCTFDESKTYFSARLTPIFGVAWEERNKLVIAVDLLQDFGRKTKFITDAKPQIYYEFNSPRVHLNAGIFPRAKLIGDYSKAFFSPDVVFYDNRLQGVLAQYRSATSPSFVEFAFNWEGMYSMESREKFRIISAGRYAGKHFYGGYALTIFHFAKSADESLNEGVIDNILVNPYVGAKFTAYFDFDVRLGYLQGLQRDRHVEAGWVTPKGGQLDFTMSRWGVSFYNRLYVGQNQMPFYNSYGTDLYAGTSFYGTTEHFYEEVGFSYSQRFFHDTLGIKCGIGMEYDGTGWGTRQMLELSVNFLKTVYKKKK